MTTSTLSWLDFSESEQRRAREIVQLFSQRESRDELGIGVVRDVFSNLMFPGVSVIQTRARYFLFIPWLFQKGAERGRTGPRLTVWVDRNERQLIEIIRRGGDEAGLIGRAAGVKVKTLPSTIYWNGLHRYGILKRAGGIEQTAAAGGRPSSLEDALTEHVDRLESVWDLNLPSSPAGFPNVERLDFGLSADESQWLRERVASACDGSLLAWLVSQRITPGATGGPWAESWREHLPPDIQRIVDHAEMFSLTMHGAAILYNELLARRCIELDIGRGAQELDTYVEWLAAWQQEINDRRAELSAWDIEDFWTLVASEHPGRIVLSRRFIDSWIELVRAAPVIDGAVGDQARSLVAGREREQKRGQARLTNERLLRQWGGSSGSDRLEFRWGQVRRMMADLNRDAEEIDAGA